MTTVPIRVCIGTYGDRDTWQPLAHQAMRSVDEQTVKAASSFWVHGPDLHTARNTAALQLPGGHEWLCFLDADDELDCEYLDAMAEVAGRCAGPVLIQPSTLGIHPDGTEDSHPVLIPPKPLIEGNYLIIGTLIRFDQFERLGGFDDWSIYEDWDLWLRAVIDGALVVSAPDAIYRVHVNPGGRNNAPRGQQLDTYQRIRHRHQAAYRAAGVT
jgi:GT2 family glycosyltransferase